MIQSKALGGRLLGVEVDGDGMIPDSLRQVLSPWTPQDAKDPSSDIPKLLYIIPTAQNPTGATLTLQRKKEIYEVFQ